MASSYLLVTNDQLQVGLIVQLVRALHWYRRGHEFEFRSSLSFFQVLLSAAQVDIITLNKNRTGVFGISLIATCLSALLRHG